MGSRVRPQVFVSSTTVRILWIIGADNFKENLLPCLLARASQSEGEPWWRILSAILFWADTL